MPVLRLCFSEVFCARRRAAGGQTWLIGGQGCLENRAPGVAHEQGVFGWHHSKPGSAPARHCWAIRHHHTRIFFQASAFVSLEGGAVPQHRLSPRCCSLLLPCQLVQRSWTRHEGFLDFVRLCSS